MVRLRASQMGAANPNPASTPSVPPAASTFPLVPLTLLRIQAVLAWALVKLDDLSPYASTKVYTRPGMESWKAILFMAVVVFMPTRQPALFLRFAVLSAVLTFGYSLLLPAIAVVAKQLQQGTGFLSLSWEEEWRRCLVMGNAVVGLVLVGVFSVRSLRTKGGGAGGRWARQTSLLGLRARRRKQL